MKRRLFVGGLAALALITPFRRLHAEARLKRAYADALRNFRAWHGDGKSLRRGDESALAYWKQSMAILNEVAAEAGLTAGECASMRSMVLFSVTDGFLLRPLIAAANPELMRKLGQEPLPMRRSRPAA